jgi:hypothetical protein
MSLSGIAHVIATHRFKVILVLLIAVLGLVLVSGPNLSKVRIASPAPRTPQSTLAAPLNSHSSVRGSAFIERMRDFPWNEFAEAAIDDRKEYVSRLISDLSEFDIIPPKANVESSCTHAPALPDPSKLDCSLYPNALKGKKNKPAKVAHMIQLGFEVDVL